MPKRVLFVCTQNTSRSQMAEGLLRLLGPRDTEILSAGIKPGSDINPHAIAAMRELGYDMSAHRAKHVCELQKILFDFVAKMDVPEADLTEFISAKWIETWEIPDPAKGGLEEFRKVRDMLAERVRREFAEAQHSRRKPANIAKPVGEGKKEQGTRALTRS